MAAMRPLCDSPNRNAKLAKEREQPWRSHAPSVRHETPMLSSPVQEIPLTEITIVQLPPKVSKETRGLRLEKVVLRCFGVLCSGTDTSLPSWTPIFTPFLLIYLIQNTFLIVFPTNHACIDRCLSRPWNPAGGFPCRVVSRTSSREMLRACFLVAAATLEDPPLPPRNPGDHNSGKVVGKLTRFPNPQFSFFEKFPNNIVLSATRPSCNQARSGNRIAGNTHHPICKCWPPYHIHGVPRSTALARTKSLSSFFPVDVGQRQATDTGRRRTMIE